MVLADFAEGAAAFGFSPSAEKKELPPSEAGAVLSSFSTGAFLPFFALPADAPREAARPRGREAARPLKQSTGKTTCFSKRTSDNQQCGLQLRAWDLRQTITPTSPPPSVVIWPPKEAMGYFGKNTLGPMGTKLKVPLIRRSQLRLPPHRTTRGTPAFFAAGLSQSKRFGMHKRHKQRKLRHQLFPRLNHCQRRQGKQKLDKRTW